MINHFNDWFKIFIHDSDNTFIQIYSAVFSTIVSSINILLTISNLLYVSFTQKNLDQLDDNDIILCNIQKKITKIMVSPLISYKPKLTIFLNKYIGTSILNEKSLQYYSIESLKNIIYNNFSYINQLCYGFLNSYAIQFLIENLYDHNQKTITYLQSTLCNTIYNNTTNKISSCNLNLEIISQQYFMHEYINSIYIYCLSDEVITYLKEFLYKSSNILYNYLQKSIQSPIVPTIDSINSLYLPDYYDIDINILIKNLTYSTNDLSPIFISHVFLFYDSFMQSLSDEKIERIKVSFKSLNDQAICESNKDNSIWPLNFKLYNSYQSLLNTSSQLLLAYICYPYIVSSLIYSSFIFINIYIYCIKRTDNIHTKKSLWIAIR